MKEFWGMAGYVLLIFGAIFIDYPIIAVLAIPIFIAGAILLINLYYNLVNKFVKLVLLGIVLNCGALAYTVIEYNQLFASQNNDEINGSFSFWSAKTLAILVIYLLASILVYAGLKKSKQFSNTKLVMLWLPIAVLLPLTILIIQYLY